MILPEIALCMLRRSKKDLVYPIEKPAKENKPEQVVYPSLIHNGSF